jgi:hypothetical protein
MCTHRANHHRAFRATRSAPRAASGCYRVAVATTRADARTQPPSRRAREPRRPSPLRPVAVVLLCAGGAAAVWLVMRAHAASHATLAFENVAGGVPPLELTFFPERLAFTAPSPPPPIGDLRLDGASSVTVAADLVPQRAVVRYRGPGIGTGYAHVELGAPLPPIKLRAPTPFAGRVGEPIGFWCFGWRCAGLQPVAGAEVVVMGGGEHGVPLASTATDADGRFVVEGVDASLEGLGLRVRAPGFALAHEPLGRVRAERTTYPVVALARARVCAGRVHAPPQLDLSRVHVLARGLPGVHTVPAADGHFVLDHVPLGVVPRVVLHGLPPTWTHDTVRVGDTPLRIDVVPGAVVRGRVVDAETGRPLADALVWCGDHDPVRSGADGRYELARLLPGRVEIEAKWELVESPRRRTAFSGRAAVVLEPAREHADVDVPISRTPPR